MDGMYGMDGMIRIHPTYVVKMSLQCFRMVQNVSNVLHCQSFKTGLLGIRYFSAILYHSVTFCIIPIPSIPILLHSHSIHSHHVSFPSHHSHSINSHSVTFPFYMFSLPFCNNPHWHLILTTSSPDPHKARPDCSAGA
jgi:hypothetical protein